MFIMFWKNYFLSALVPFYNEDNRNCPMGAHPSEMNSISLPRWVENRMVKQIIHGGSRKSTNQFCVDSGEDFSSDKYIKWG